MPELRKALHITPWNVGSMPPCECRAEPTTGLDFGQAIAAMREGRRVAQGAGEDRMHLRINEESLEQTWPPWEWRWSDCHNVPEERILATDWEVVE